MTTLLELDRLVRNPWGKVVPGATLYVYEAGPNGEPTTDPATGYTSFDADEEVAYPLTADEEGTFPDAYFPPALYWTYCPDDTVRPLRQWNAANGLVGLLRGDVDETISAFWTMRKLAVGDAGDAMGYPEARLRVYSEETSYSGARYVGSEHQHYAAPSAAPSAAIDYHGLDLFVQTSGANLNSNVGLYPAEFSAVHNTSATIGRAIGVYGYVQNLTTGTIGSDGSAFQGRVRNASTGTMNNGNVFYARAPMNDNASGHISVFAAYRSDDHSSLPAGVTDAYHAFWPGGKSYLGGKLGIGTYYPAGALHLGSDAGTNISGLVFGSANDLTLYRSAAGVLSVGGSIISSGGLITSAGYFQTANGAGSNRAIFGYANGANAAGYSLGASLDTWTKRIAAGVQAMGATGDSLTAPTMTGAGLMLANVSAAPSSNPAGGPIIYAEGGALKCRGTGGTVTTLAAP